MIQIKNYYFLWAGLGNPWRSGARALSGVLLHHLSSFPASGTLLSDINICNRSQLSCNFNKGVREEKVLVGSVVVNT